MIRRASKPSEDRRAVLARALQLVAQGDRAAFEAIYKQTSARLFGVCLRILGDEAEAEDVLREVYLTVWRRADRFDHRRASAITWLAALARNRAIDQVRARGPRTAPSAGKVEPAALTGPEARRLERCLAALEADEAQAVRAAFLEGLTYAELSARFDSPLGTVKTSIHRALTRLRPGSEAA